MKNNCVKWIAGSFLFFFLVACESADPDLNELKSGIEISFYDAACLEAWIYVDFSRNEPCSFRLDYDKFSREYELTGNDTILYIDSLSPGMNYDVKGWKWKNYKWLEAGNVEFTTLEPTSHDIEWEVHYPGDGRWSGYFNDIAIISEDNLLCAGTFIETAEDGSDMFPYNNLAVWDGNKWEKKSIMFLSIYGHTYPDETYSVQGFKNGTALLSIPGGAQYYTGEEWIQFPLQGTRENPYYAGRSIWGFSIDDFYIGGAFGSLSHWKNNSWSRMYPDVDGVIWEIWGCVNKITGREQALAVGSIEPNSFESIVFRVDSEDEMEKWELDLGRVWTKNGHPIYTTSQALPMTNKTGEWLPLEGAPRLSGYFRGNDNNDLYYMHRGGISHFNGVDWSTYYHPYYLWMIDVKGDVIAAEGYSNSEPIVVVVGRRK